MMTAPAPHSARLSIGVTGHRNSNTIFGANRDVIQSTLEALLTHIETVVVSESRALGEVMPLRLYTLLADGADQMAAGYALAKGWELGAPLPFGQQLNLAINALPENLEDAKILLAGERPTAAQCRTRADAIAHFYGSAALFELAEQDAQISALFLARLSAPDDIARAQACSAAISGRVALAGRVMIEQSDVLIAIWDGATRILPGGTGHTVATALEMGTPVVLIDPAKGSAWHILHAPEALSVQRRPEGKIAELDSLIRTALRPGEGGALSSGAKNLAAEAWYPRSSKIWTGYRRVEALFDGGGRPFRSLVQIYETPDEIARCSAASLLGAARALPGGDAAMVAAIETKILRRFAWADGISARLSDAYRGGMVANFLLSALAIVMGIAYQPFASTETKWIFASVEFVLLSAILFITWLGGKWRWHKRWFETRRVAEYFRHAPILLLLGVARPTGRWPRGAETSWPEYYARHGLRALGLPKVKVTTAYLRAAMQTLLDAHITSQRDYHFAKAKKLTSVHHRLDRLSERLFLLAVISVSTYLLLAAAAGLELVPKSTLKDAAKIFTFLGVMFPTFGASIAGMRYFGDFERFAAISQVTAQKLDAVHTRISVLLSAPDSALDYGQVAELAHAADDVVVSEIESWQAVFGGKHITVPV